MFKELHYEDLTFGFFPKAADTCRNAYDSWLKNSVRDVVDMLMQILEVSFTTIFSTTVD